jgi:hypothetical protein
MMSILTWDDSVLRYTTIKLTRISIAMTRGDEDTDVDNWVFYNNQLVEIESYRAEE